MLRRTWALLLLLVVFPCVAHAIPTGAINYASNALQIYNGTSYVSVTGVVSSTTCTTGGQQERFGNEVSFCNGTNWVSPSCSGRMSISGTCPLAPVAGRDYIGSSYFTCNGANWRRWATSTCPAYQPSTGYNHACALKADQTLWCWGKNSSALGDGTTTNRLSPVQVSDTDAWLTVTTGTGDSYDHTCGIKADNTLWCWGYNGDGQLGDNSTTDRRNPVQIGTDTWLDVQAAYDYTCGIKTDGSMWCWGYGSDGSLGNGGTSNVQVPTAVSGGATWIALASHRSSTTCGIQSDHTLWCWGYNSDGEVGDGSTTNRKTPVQIGSDTWSYVTGGDGNGCGFKTDGTLWCWGYNGDGEVGDGTTTSPRKSPVQITGTWSSVAISGYIGCAIKASDSTLWCWGDNSSGGVGDGSTTDRHSPVQIGSDAWQMIDTGSRNGFACGLKTDNTFWCWGYNGDSEVGDGTTTTPRKSPVQISPF